MNSTAFVGGQPISRNVTNTTEPAVASTLTNVQEGTVQRLVDLEHMVEEMHARLLGPSAKKDEVTQKASGSLETALEIRSRVCRIQETVGLILASL